LRLAALVSVFDDNAETKLSVVVPDGSENPNAGSIHLNNYIGPFRWSKKERVDGSTRRHRISVECNYGEAMTG
jgi:hypothetical protein